MIILLTKEDYFLIYKIKKIMGKRILLIVFLLFSFYLYYEMFSDTIDIFSYIGSAILLGFQTLSCIWLYKDIIGLEKFEDGLTLKRKK
jgi:hypothetical protein